MEREDKRTRGEGRPERGGRGGGRGGRRGGRGFGRPGGWQQADLPSTDDTAAWLDGPTARRLVHRRPRDQHRPRRDRRGRAR